MSKLNNGENVFGLAALHFTALANSDVGDQATLFPNQVALDVIVHIRDVVSRSNPNARFKPLFEQEVNVLKCINEDTFDLLVLKLLGNDEGLILHQEIVLEVDFLETASRRAVKDHL